MPFLYIISSPRSDFKDPWPALCHSKFARVVLQNCCAQARQAGAGACTHRNISDLYKQVLGEVWRTGRTRRCVQVARACFRSRTHPSSAHTTCTPCSRTTTQPPPVACLGLVNGLEPARSYYADEDAGRPAIPDKSP